ncbi:hypothetical protein ACNKF0_19685 [Nocardioides sp. T5]|uniref:hypothetical protein n=1 Tax=Nocardioides sp. T5 TaxID=3400182 RepID=UPI003A840D58
MLDSAASEIVAATIELPRSWNNYAIDAVWTNVGAWAGNVVLRCDNATRGTGETIATPGSAVPVTAAAGAAGVIMTTTLIASAPNTTGELLVLGVVRAGADAADTLANDIGLLGLRLRRAG